MAAEIYVVSGFLGAGKTTLIQKLLREAFSQKKVVLIENDFGEISVDAALLKSGSIEVKELNSGCICCSLAGDFVRALQELLERFHPDIIIIEPSGVGRLSDIIKACLDPRILPLAEVKAKITVVDVKRCQMYLDNFGEFFEDQIEKADVILLSRTGNFPGKVNDAYEMVKNLNGHAVTFSKPWEQIKAAEITAPGSEPGGCTDHCGLPGCGCENHDEHGLGHDCHCHPVNLAEDIFDTITIRTKRVFSIEELKMRVLNMERQAKGTILRAKGIVRGVDGYINLQYLPGDICITNCAAHGDMVCIIGRNLNRQELCTLLGGE